MAKKLSHIISHWYNLIGGIQESSQNFYVELEVALNKRQVPEIEISRIDYSESGIYSAKREYFRVQRNEHIFDICAAPFGNGFFVSWWLGGIKPSAALATIIAYGLIFFLLYSTILIAGFLQGLKITFIILVLLFFALGVLNENPGNKFTEPLMAIAGIGPLFKLFFKPETYYRIDTALMFQSTVHSAILEVIDSITKAQGVRALSELERKPIFNEIFKR